MRKLPILAVAALTLCTALQVCEARSVWYGVVSYPSSLLCPPEGFLWVPISFFPVLILVNVLFTERVHHLRWYTSLFAAVIACLGYVGGCLAVGSLLEEFDLKGLRWAQEPANWSPFSQGYHHGPAFIVWNLLGLVFLAYCVKIACRRLTISVSRKALILWANIFIYLLWFIPVAAIGVWSHDHLPPTAPVSTPVSPPYGFWWLTLGFLISIPIVTYMLSVTSPSVSWHRAAIVSVVLISAYSLIFLCFGLFIESLRHISPLHWGYPVFWGRGWRDDGYHFLVWNSVSIALLLGAVALMLRGLRVPRRRRKTLLVVNAVVYLMFLVPFVWTGAISHGWTGNGIRRLCNWHIKFLGNGLAMYVLEHGNCLPKFSAAQPPTSEIMAYFPADLYPEFYIDRCARGRAFEKHPKPYVWNDRLAGQTVTELQRQDSATAVISCPYHDGLALTVGELLERIRDPNRFFPHAD